MIAIFNLLALPVALFLRRIYSFADGLAVDLFFNGNVKGIHKTRFAVEKFVVRYGQSIKTLNRAIVLSVAFVPIALSPIGHTVKIPMVELEVTRQGWLRICPLISYGLQGFTLAALCWFLLMRRGLYVLKEKLGEVE